MGILICKQSKLRSACPASSFFMLACSYPIACVGENLLAVCMCPMSSVPLNDIYRKVGAADVTSNGKGFPMCCTCLF